MNSPTPTNARFRWTLSLFGVLCVAKILTVLGHVSEWNLATPWVLFWQDALVTLVFAVFERLLRPGSKVIPILYTGLVLYTAINVPIARILSSALTMRMFSAVDSTLGDYIGFYLTFSNLALIVLVLLVAWAFPRFRLQGSRRITQAGVVALLGFLLIGPFNTQNQPGPGWHRTALVTLLNSAQPRIRESWANGPLDDSEPASASGPALSRFHGSAKGFNVVLVLLESTGATYLRPYGAAVDPMPNLTRWASDGLVFEQVYAVTPDSMKSFFSALWSRCPGFDVSIEESSRVSTPSLSQWLHKEGYRTALFHSGRFDYLGMDHLVRAASFQTARDAADLGGQKESSFGVEESTAVSRILNWVDSQREGPFFLTYVPIAGHHPYHSENPGPFSSNSLQEAYYASLHGGDVSLRDLVEGFKARGLDRKTVFIFLGDHGEAFGQHGGNHGHTLFIYEENIRVPGVVHAPGISELKGRMDVPLSLVDVGPMILDLLGLPPPASYQGISPFSHRRKTVWFFADYSQSLVGLRQGDFKLIHHIETGGCSLYDLRKDPGERNDLSEKMPSLTRDYQAQVRNWAAQQKRELRKTERNSPSKKNLSSVPSSPQ